MTSLLCKILSNERMALFSFMALSAAALALAFISQYVYGLQPCHLCVYQRIAYGVAIFWGLAGIALSRSQPKAGRMFIALTALTFAANAVIAFYHSGVERHWWKSFVEGCMIPDMKGSITDVLAQIAATPVARCDEIPWTDPFIGLSMANYNVMACLVLMMLALCALKRRA